MKMPFNRRSVLLVAIITVGGWLLFHRNEIRNVSDAWQVASRQIKSLTDASPIAWTSSSDSQLTAARTPGTFRIASFNLHNFGPAKSKRPHVLDLYAKIIRQFDIVAVQGIRTEDTNTIASLLDAINASNGPYAILTSPRLGRTQGKHQYAFIYNTRVVQPLGRPYVVADPDGLLNRPPFVGWFRTVGIPDNRAFTFSLVNHHIEAEHAESEVLHLLDLCRAVRQDGRHEDDVILTGTLQVGDHDLTPLLAGTSYNWLIRSQGTVVDGDWQVDNFIVDSKSTVEFTGRSGVLDFLRLHNLSVAQALEVSEHLPIWAEFFQEEGRSSGLVATESPAALR